MIAIWIILTILGAVNAGMNLRTADKPPPIGREHIDITYVLDIMLNEFPNWRQPTAFAVFGLDEEPVEWGKSHDKNKAKFDGSGAKGISTPRGQRDLLNLCRAADLGRSSKSTRCDDEACIIKGSTQAEPCAKDDDIWREHGVYVAKDIDCLSGRYCFMEEFARFWASQVDNCHSNNASAVCTNSNSCAWDENLTTCYGTKTEVDYVGLSEQEFIALLGGKPINSNPGSTFEAYMKLRKEVVTQNSRVYEYSLYEEMTAVALTPDKTKIKAAYIGWNVTYGTLNTVVEANEIYDRWNEFMDDHKGSTGGFQTTELYVFRATQNEMVKGAILGICLSLVVSYIVILLTTMNWWTATIGLVNLLAIVAVFLGILPLIGWQLGEYECIFMIATVGLSVDYTVHLLHAYNNAHKKGSAMDRKDKAQHALGEMGISVISSAVTTLLAASILFACGFYFFFQFGAFIFIVIGLSILASITFLMPLIMVIGPNDNQGDIRMCCRRPQEKSDQEKAQTQE